jgi:NAD(P)-dependent dehydrogenase (short-subunit alcohol dehydrogenase family)
LSWTNADIPDLTGATAMVTGANAGIGYWIALHLARNGAEVVLACRSVPKAEAALADLRAAVRGGAFEILPLDLADLASVRAAADEFGARHDRLDVLVNNAGIALAKQGRTTDGFESHLGTNFLGHFALTGLLLDAVLAAPQGRVVHTGSLQHRTGRLDLTDLGFDRRRYLGVNAYAQSKVATLLVMGELERRLRAAGASAISLGAHPGVAGTNIADGYTIRNVRALDKVIDFVLDRYIPSPEAAATSTLFAATSPQALGGTYTGPSRRAGTSGPPAPARLSGRAQDPAVARQLWDIAERLTGVTFRV